MNTVLRELPFPILTERLMIRPPFPGDGRALNEAVVESIEELRPWLPWADKKSSLEESEENVRRAYARWILREDLRLSLFLRGTGEMVGSSGLHRIKWEVPCFEIGYWARTRFAGKGLIKEAAQALTVYAFKALGARRVEIRVDPLNERSAAIPKILGFKLEGLLKMNSLQAGGELRDTLVFARNNAEGLGAEKISWESDPFNTDKPIPGRY